MKVIVIILGISFFGCSCLKAPKEQKIEFQPNESKNEKITDSADKFNKNQSEVELINELKSKAVDEVV